MNFEAKNQENLYFEKTCVMQSQHEFFSYTCY